MSRIPKIPCPKCNLNLAASNLCRVEVSYSKAYLDASGTSWKAMADEFEHYECYSCDHEIHDDYTLDLLAKWSDGWSEEDEATDAFEDES